MILEIDLDLLERYRKLKFQKIGKLMKVKDFVL
jgi:hypothetical protein